uniref:Putative myosin light chain kinase smooth muscle-like protein ovary overexpressed n=1 Tax=Rhipicephalus microplus TaxID=6941 RepID=A0A6M2D5R7_RHIMP
MLNKHVFFLVQVSYLSGAKCFRSNDPFLVLLPCPQKRKCAFCSLLCSLSSFFFDVLLLCGDVEQNPGPNDDKVSRQLRSSKVDSESDHELLLHVLEGQKEIIRRMNDYSTAQTSLQDTLVQLKDRLDSLEASVIPIANAQEQFASMKSHMQSIDKSIASIADKVDDLENRSRRNNIIIHGFREPADETLSSLCECVSRDFFQEKLQLSINGMERCHRIGSKRPHKTRPIVIKLLDYREKQSILKNCGKLKNSGMYVTEDYSEKVRNIRKRLWDCTSVHRERGDRVRKKKEKKSVNGTLYTWDEASNDKVAVSRNAKQ